MTSLTQNSLRLHPFPISLPILRRGHFVHGQLRRYEADFLLALQFNFTCHYGLIWAATVCMLTWETITALPNTLDEWWVMTIYGESDEVTVVMSWRIARGWMDESPLPPITAAGCIGVRYYNWYFLKNVLPCWSVVIHFPSPWIF